MNLPRKKGPDAPVVRKGIRVKLDMPRVLDRLKTAKDHTKIQELADMVQAVEQMPGAKAGYVRAQATGIDSESAAVTLGPAVFSSRILAKSLAHGGAAFALLATLGPEARKTAQKETDLLKSWWWQGLFDMALEQVVARVTDEIKDRFSIKCLSILSPGSLEEDWPLDQQRELFCLLDGLPEQLGVTLSDNMVMNPNFSLSGLLFETKTAFCSCAFCPRKSCESRRMPFDADLRREYLGADKAG